MASSSPPVKHGQCLLGQCGAFAESRRGLLVREGDAWMLDGYICASHFEMAKAMLGRRFGTLEIYHWPRCRWCDALLDVQRYLAVLHEGFEPGDPVYCEPHRTIEGRYPIDVINQGVRDALAFDALDESLIIRYPQRMLHRMVGPLLPKRVSFVAGYSQGGKTSFMTNQIRHWILEDGIKLQYIPTESSVDEIMTRFACFEAKVHPDDALSMRLREAALAGDELARMHREDVKIALALLRTNKAFQENLRIEPIESLTPKSFDRAMEAAHAMGCKLAIVDHTEQTEADADDYHPDIVISNKVQLAALRAAKRYDMHLLLLSQLNGRLVGPDPLARLRPPSPDWLYNKGKKEMIAQSIVGLHYVVRPDATLDELRMARNREIDLKKVMMPHTMGVSSMKARYGVGTISDTIHLHYENGRLSDKDVDLFDHAGREDMRRIREMEAGRMRQQRAERPDTTNWMDV